MDAFVRLRSKTTGDWFVHPDLRRRLVADARDQGTNMTEVALRILADAYGVDYAGEARKTEPRDDDDKIVLRLPVELRDAIKRAHPDHWQDGLRATLCAHYRLAVPQNPHRRAHPAAA